MARSTKKGPYVHPSVLKKIQKASASGRNEVIKTWSRSTVILPQMMGLTFGVYNGNKFIPVQVTDQMIGMKLGEFAPTRTFNGHTMPGGDKTAKKG